MGDFRRGSGERQAVVLSEIARLGARLSEGLLDASRVRFGDVLVERARRGACGEDALDGGEIEGAVVGRVAERSVDLLGRVALSKEQHLPRLRGPHARRTEAHHAKEPRRVVAHVHESHVDLIEVDGCVPPRRGMEPRRIER